MKLKFKLNLQQFGGIQARIDERAGGGGGDSKNLVTITLNGIKYDVPESAYKGAGIKGNFFAWDDQGDADDLIEYTKYYIESGGNVTAGGFQQYIKDNKYTLQGDLFGEQNSQAVDTRFATVSNTLDTNFKTSQEQGLFLIDGKSGTVTGGAGLTPPGTTPPGSVDPVGVNVSQDQIGAFNAYYNDLYSLAPGTGGAEMLGRLEQSYANQAQQAATMADVGFQQAALQQASTVKQITDQVRSERMARLRAGMSESQIANQDMQMLMSNVNTLNQNAQMLNQQRLEAQIGMNTAQDQAYMDFLNQANTRGQVATGMAASDAGDAYQQTIRQMTTLYGNDPTKWTAAQWTETSNRVSTGNPAGNVTR
jgi:hypothetical protein